MELGGRRAQHAREHLRRRRLLEMLHPREAEAWRREAAKGRGASVLGRLVVVAQRVQRARDHLARTCTVAALRRRARSLDHSPHAHSRSLSTRAHTQCTPRLAQRRHPALALPRGGHPVAPRWRTTQTPDSGHLLASGRPLGARPATRGWARACRQRAAWRAVLAEGRKGVLGTSSGSAPGSLRPARCSLNRLKSLSRSSHFLCCALAHSM